MTEEELIQLYWERDPDAIAVTRELYGAYCRTIAWNILRNEQDTEECLSDSWLKVWNAIPPTRPEHFKGWLAVIVRNCALSLCRCRNRQPAIVDGALELMESLSFAPERETESQALGEAISAFLWEQPEEIRTAFLRRYWYGEAVKEVAVRLGWSEGKTKTVLFRTRTKLRRYLEKEEWFDERELDAGRHEPG